MIAFDLKVSFSWNTTAKIVAYIQPPCIVMNFVDDVAVLLDTCCGKVYSSENRLRLLCMSCCLSAK